MATYKSIPVTLNKDAPSFASFREYVLPDDSMPKTFWTYDKTAEELCIMSKATWRKPVTFSIDALEKIHPFFKKLVGSANMDTDVGLKYQVKAAWEHWESPGKYLGGTETTAYYLRKIEEVVGYDTKSEQLTLIVYSYEVKLDVTENGEKQEVISPGGYETMWLGREALDELFPSFFERAIAGLALGLAGEDIAAYAKNDTDTLAIGHGYILPKLGLPS